MPLPKSAVKIKKNGVELISNVERTKYLLVELQRAALRDTAKLLRKRIIAKLKNLKGMKRSKRIYRSTQFWVRRRETDLQIGFKHDSWYGVHQELGTKSQPKRSTLRDTVFENIDDIRRVQGQYLSAIADENRALGLIDEKDEGGNEQDG
jgi:hypothetical protein